MEFEEIVASLRSQNETADPTVYDDLTAHYTQLNENYNAIKEGGESALKEKDLRIQGLEAQISQLKTKNYDLLMSNQQVDPVENPPLPHPSPREPPPKPLAAKVQETESNTETINRQKPTIFFID